MDFLHCFLLSLQGINGILADEMGLGKTVQSIALLAHLAEVRQHTRIIQSIVPQALVNENMSRACY